MQELPEKASCFGNYYTPKNGQSCSSTAFQIVASLYQKLIDSKIHYQSLSKILEKTANILKKDIKSDISQLLLID